MEKMPIKMCPDCNERPLKIYNGTKYTKRCIPCLFALDRKRSLDYKQSQRNEKKITLEKECVICKKKFISNKHNKKKCSVDCGKKNITEKWLEKTCDTSPKYLLNETLMRSHVKKTDWKGKQYNAIRG